MPRTILLVDDDLLLRRSLAFSLEQAGYQVQATASAEEALIAVQENRPQLVLLDIGLPGMDGLEALRRFRDQVPVILLTARQRHLDEVLGLELGADDYVTKPFEFDVLLARIHTVLRRAERMAPEAPTIIVAGDLVIDLKGHTVKLGERLINLSPREFSLLALLARHADRVLPTDELLTQVWGQDFVGESQIVYVYVRALREKLESNPHQPQRLLTVRGVGYKLAA